MKKMKKAWACAGSVALTFCCGFAGLAAMSTPAFAVDANGTCTVDGADTAYTAQLKITFTNSANDSKERTFSAYKIAGVSAVKTGDTSGYKLSAVPEADSALSTALVTAGKFDEIIINDEAPVKVLGDLTSDNWKTDSQSILRKTANALKSSTDNLGTPKPLTASGNTATADVEPGVYFVVETTDRSADGSAEGASSVPMIIPTKLTSTDDSNCTFVGESELKATQPVLTKTLTSSAPSALVGEDLNYDLDITVPVRAGYDRGNPYTYYVVETLPEGLTYKAGSATIGGTKVEPAQDGQKLIWNFSDQDLKSATELALIQNGAVKTQKALLQGDSVKLSYVATANDKLAPGDVANPSTAALYFSNNPSNAASLGKSESVAKVYQGKLTINKKDGASSDLAGTTFKVTSTNGYSKVVADAADGDNNDGTADGALEFSGLKVDADGEIYKVEETKAPAGYDSIKTFYVKATLKADEGTIAYELVDESGSPATPANVALTQSNGLASVEVTDTKLLTDLAHTGGNVALIVLGASVLLGVSVVAGKARRARV